MADEWKASAQRGVSLWIQRRPGAALFVVAMFSVILGVYLAAYEDVKPLASTLIALCVLGILTTVICTYPRPGRQPRAGAPVLTPESRRERRDRVLKILQGLSYEGFCMTWDSEKGEFKNDDQVDVRSLRMWRVQVQLAIDTLVVGTPTAEWGRVLRRLETFSTSSESSKALWISFMLNVVVAGKLGPYDVRKAWGGVWPPDQGADSA